MASFESEIQSLMAALAPEGGFGIQNLEAVKGQQSLNAARMLRALIGGDMEGLERAGLSRSVGGAFSGGARRLQSQQQLGETLTNLETQNSQLAESQRQSLMSMLAPVAQERANRPSWFSSLLGGALGLGMQAAIPALGAKSLLLNPQLDFLKSALGPSNTTAPGYNPGSTKALLNALSLGLR